VLYASLSISIQSCSVPCRSFLPQLNIRKMPSVVVDVKSVATFDRLSHPNRFRLHLQARNYIRSLPPMKRKDFKQVFKGANPLGECEIRQSLQMDASMNVEP
jgi:hypothetical protein